MSSNLVNNLGGTAGFGEAFLPRNDDGSTALIDIRSVFPQGLNFFGVVWTSVYINNNGNITFATSTGTFTPTQITGTTSNPIIAPFWGDVDTRGTAGGITPGGTSTGTNLMWYDLDSATGTFTVTWDDVGYYNSASDKLNAFQLQLIKVGESDFDIVFRYEDVNWTTGSASGGTGGLGGTVARAGYSSGDGLNYFELPQSGNQAGILALENSSNVGETGKWVFGVRSGTPIIAISIVDIAQVEGNGPGTSVMTFDVILSAPVSQVVKVDYYTQIGTAGAGDFNAVGGTVVFAAGQTRQTISVDIIGDSVTEADETFSVVLTNPVNAVVSDNLAVGTIVNDDGLVISDVTVVEGSGTGTTTAVFTVRLLKASTSRVTVNFETQAGTADADVDFTSSSGSVSFAPGETSQSVSVNVTRDALTEASETFRVLLSGAVGAVIADDTGVGTITNDDGFAVNDVAQFEGSGSGTTAFVFNVSLLSPLASTATVNYQVAGLSAASGSDFQPLSGTLSFAAGEVLKQVTVLVNKDSQAESDETFRLVLSDATGAALADDSGTGTIRNDDTLSVADTFVVEGDAGTANLVFTVTLSTASAGSVTVDYATVAGTATAGVDYTGVSGTLTFAPGETTRTVTVPVIGDMLPEASETVTLQLSNAVGTGIANGTSVGVIRNDDGLSVTSPATVDEGNTGTKTVIFTVNLSTAASEPIQVDYATADGTATAGSDYIGTAGTLTFAIGETSKTVAVTIKGDTAFEPNETFRLVLSNPVGTELTNESGSVTIRNDDTQPPPSLYVSDVFQSEGTGTGNSTLHFLVTLARPTTGGVTVNYATSGVTATPAVDFIMRSGTLYFAEGETTKEVLVPVIRDALAEPNETLRLVLSNLQGLARTGNTTGVGTILNDDVALSVNDLTLPEGDSGATNATFTVSLNTASPLPVEVSYSTASQSAMAIDDFSAITGTLVFAPGETVKSLIVPVTGDSNYEASEAFQLVLSSPLNATLERSAGTATVINDDAPPALSVGDVSISEGEAGSRLATFTVTLSFASPVTTTVDYVTVDGTAGAPGDYTSVSGNLSFQPGETTRQVQVPVTGDRLHEASETFQLRLSNPVSATLGRDTGTATLVNDDAAPAPVITGITDDTGASATDGVTNDTTPTLLFTAVTGQTLRVYDGDTLLGTAGEDAPGQYRFTSAALADGLHTFRATVTDGAGLTSAFSTPRPLTLDLTAPAVRQITPGDEAIAVPVTSQIGLAFSEPIQRGTGTIQLLTATGAVVESFDAATSPRLTVSGDTLTIDPTATLDNLTGYRVELGTGSVSDLAGNASAGAVAGRFTTAASQADDYQAGAATTGQVSVGGSASGTIEINGDRDWFAIPLIAGQPYLFRLNAASVNGLSDPYLSILSAGGNLLSANDDAPASLNSLLPYTAAVTGTHYLEARGFSGSAGAYTLSAQIAGVTDTTAPTVVSFSPADEATAVAVNSSVVVTFSEAIQRGFGMVHLKTAAGAIVESFDTATSTRLTVSGSTLTVDPSADLSSAAGYQVSFATGTVRDLAGNAFAGTNRFNFTTAGDTTAPTVIRFSPADQAGAVAVGSNLVLTFDEPIQRGSGVLLLKDATGAVIESFDAATSDRLTVSGATLTLDPGANLSVSTGYQVVIAAGNVRDLAGNAHAGTTDYRFTTAANSTDDYSAAAGTIGSLTAGSSVNGAIETNGDRDWFAVTLATGQSYAFRLNAVGGTGLSDPFLSLYDAGGNLLGANDDTPGSRNSLLSFAPGSAGTYYLEASGYESSTGNYTLSAQATAITDTTAPTVFSFSPADGASGVAISSNLVISFSETIARGTGTINLTNAAGTVIESFDAATSTRLSVLGSTLTVDPATLLANGTTYRLAFAAGTVRDLAGNAYAGTDSYDFTTALDTVAPTVVSFSPADQAGAVAVGSNITLTFSEAIQRGEGTVLLKTAAGAVIESFDAASSARLTLSGSTLTVDPTAPLGNASGYRVEFSAGNIRDLAGNAFAGTTRYQFTTVAAASGDDFAATSATAGRVTVGSSTTGLIETSGDRDWFAVTLNVGETYALRLNGAASGALSDPLLTLYNSSGAVVGSNDDIDPGNPNSLITYSPSIGGTHYLEARHYGTGLGAYTLSADPVTAPAPGSFSITVNYSGHAGYQHFFEEAAQRWAQVITGDLPDVASSRGLIDDLMIDASVTTLDGVGQVLAQASATAVRSGGLPYLGLMRFDVADIEAMVSNGTFASVVLHEMGHVLGLTPFFWQQRGLVSGANPSSYTGANAVAAYDSLTPATPTSVPLETNGGAGIAGSHWLESVFDRELMTGYAESAAPMPLSIITVGALADLGYQVNYAAADAFTL